MRIQTNLKCSEQEETMKKPMAFVMASMMIGVGVLAWNFLSGIREAEVIRRRVLIANHRKIVIAAQSVIEAHRLDIASKREKSMAVHWAGDASYNSMPEAILALSPLYIVVYPKSMHLRLHNRPRVELIVSDEKPNLHRVTKIADGLWE